MGKYMRKSNGKVAVMEVSHQSTIGVRTRAKTLALQRLQKSNELPTSLPSFNAQSSPSPSSYLQLRSRRLEKTPLLSSPRNKGTCTDRSLAYTEIGGGSGSQFNSGNSRSQENEGEIEVSFGENFLELETRNRNSRETTPCSLILKPETMLTSGSTTRSSYSSVITGRTWDPESRNIPTTHEMEEFFAGAEQSQQRMFIEKYNYDPVNDCPLPGVYEWVELNLGMGKRRIGEDEW